MTEKKQYQCSLIIRAYNEGQHIGRLLEGVRHQIMKDVEIILVDSGSTDDTVQIAENYDVKVITITPEEFTFGRSLNRGISAALADYVIIVSAHCYPVFPDWLEQLLIPFKDDQVALSYGKQRGGTTNKYSEHQFFRKYFPDISMARQSQPYSHNANAAIRKSVWDLHPYNENLTGLEDLSWSSWVLQEGYAISYVAEAEVIHVHDEGPRQTYNRYMREAIALKQILPDSRFSLWNFLRLWTSSTISDILQARREAVLSRNLASILWFRFIQYWGTYRGYAYSGKVDASLHQAFSYPPGILAEKTPAPRPIQPIDYMKKDGE
jgi:rhamnosyltransferase